MKLFRADIDNNPKESSKVYNLRLEVWAPSMGP